MSLWLVICAISVLFASAAAAALAGRRDRVALFVGTAGSVAGSLLGAAGSLIALFAGGTVEIVSAWPLPLGTLRIGIDAISAFFLLCVFVVSGLSAIYAAGYFGDLDGRRLAAPAALMNALAGAMVGVVIARDGVVFLAAWETMALASFFLVLLHGERAETRKAATVYLVASHAGALPLFVLFVLLADNAGNFDFAVMRAAAPAAPLAGTCFLLALAGFGAKAGFWPMHVWLPDAHPAAPSPVSAVMSGVMIKMGIYGLVRVLTLLGQPPPWWGVLVLCIGAVSGVAGVLHALAQHELKRLLAYHSVENIGIITMGLGIGLIGQATGRSTVAFLGYAGALLHVLNHGLFKGLLFQGAGSVEHGAGTRDLDALGGLYRRMPTTAVTFLIGSAAISGLPPLNGFVSELLIYAGAFVGAATLPSAFRGWALAAVPTLALIGGLAAACFVKAFGIVFLGEPRTPAAARAHESGAAMRASMIVGAALCVGLGVVPVAGLALVSGAGMQLAGRSFPPAVVIDVLSGVSFAAAALVVIALLLVAVRAGLLRERDVRAASTWGCGYEAPTARMQYTASSFAEPVIRPFIDVFKREAHKTDPDGYFPSAASSEEHLGDRADSAFRWLVDAFVGAMGSVLVFERGGSRRYLVYVLVTLVTLLFWQLALRN